MKPKVDDHGIAAINGEGALSAISATGFAWYFYATEYDSWAYGPWYAIEPVTDRGIQYIHLFSSRRV